MVSIQKKVLTTFLRSATQATESTFMGCMAKSAATKALLQKAPVIHLKTMKSKRLFAMWNIRPVKWCFPGCNPYNWQSRAWESQVTGCQ